MAIKSLGKIIDINRGRREALSIGAAAAASLIGVPSARAQTAHAWPTRQQIRIFCGFAPGGTTDPYARMLGDYMAQKLNATVVVENRVGAGGFISLEALARAPADGYTIGITTSTSVWGSRALYRKLPFDADRDFVPITWLPVGPLLFAVPTTLPVNSVAEWIDMAKTRSMSMASYGPASVPHLATEEFNQRYGTRVNVIHYKGEGPMWPDVSTGVTQGGIGSYVALAPHLARGSVKVLAKVGEEVSPKLPDVKSFVSQGFDGQVFKVSGGLVMLAPTGTPNDILNRMSEAFVEAADSPKGLALRDAFAIDAKPTTMVEVQRRWRDESPIWIKLTESLNMKID